MKARMMIMAAMMIMMTSAADAQEVLTSQALSGVAHTTVSGLIKRTTPPITWVPTTIWVIAIRT